MEAPTETEPQNVGTWSIVIVSDEAGWPPTSGYRRRIAEIVRVASDLGRVCWVAAPRGHGGDAETLTAEFGVDAVVVGVPSRRTAATALRWMRGRLPWALAAADWRDADRALCDVNGHHDLLIAFGIDSWRAALRCGIHARHTVIDTDLESAKLRSRLDAALAGNPLRRAITTRDVARWQKLERIADQNVDAICVPSEAEASTLRRGWYVPNTYDADRCRVTAESSDVETVLFIGSLSYEPNADGLTWFTTAIWPLVRSAHPHAQLRVVGGGLPETNAVRHVDGVELLGQIDEVGPEFERATATVVPIRWGGGTRIKILEAFAHRSPVVSTSLGASGLGATNERHLLIADEAADFAHAISRILRDPGLRSMLVTHGTELLHRRFSSTTVRAGLRRRLVDLLDSPHTDHEAAHPHR